MKGMAGSCRTRPQQSQQQGPGSQGSDVVSEEQFLHCFCPHTCNPVVSLLKASYETARSLPGNAGQGYFYIFYKC